MLAHKLREAIGAKVHDPAAPELSGEVQIDGLYTGGNVRPENRKADRADRRLADTQTGKRQVVVIAREPLGSTVPFVVAKESDAVPMIRRHVASGSIIHADEASGWDILVASYDMRRVNHSREFKGDDGACTNAAELFFSRLRRAQDGIHHRIAGPYLIQYARRNGVARRSPPRLERGAMALDHLRRPSPPEIENLALLLAAQCGSVGQRTAWPKSMLSLP